MTMDDLIYRADAINAANDAADDWDGGPDKGREKMIREGLNAVPAVDAAPVKHGKWELVDEAEPRRYGCSKCSCLSWYGTYKYCPNCGAKMDLEE
jgi:NADH pyrophosphatase NudC (nudix superfamily)